MALMPIVRPGATVDDAGKLTHTSKKTISTHTNSKNAVNTEFGAVQKHSAF